jgi:hypothetical protein
MISRMMMMMSVPIPMYMSAYLPVLRKKHAPLR